MKNNLFNLLAATLLALGVLSCATYYFRSNYTDANRLIHGTASLKAKPFLKAHLKNGDVCILKDTWSVDTVSNTLSGKGMRFDYNRKQTFEGAIQLPIDSIIIFETNNELKDPEAARFITLGILAGVNVGVGGYCITNPKACFGSCPTFYLKEDDNFHYADAEGFSNAISPSMEYYDIDALNQSRMMQHTFSITMKNEALETHCVEAVKLLAYPLEKSERVYQSPTNGFYLCENNYSLSSAAANEGTITALLKNPDRLERFSLADENNLNSKEAIYLTFDQVENTENLGLVLHFRQTLMTTYLFYSAMGYMGDQVSDIFTILETDEAMRFKFDATTRELGGIDCYIWDERTKDWIWQSKWYETGPIAINRQLIPLQNGASGSSVNIKLVLNKGLWRIDHAALTNIKMQVTPAQITPSAIFNEGKPDRAALAQINTPDQYLVSMPGSAFRFDFTLPQAPADYEFFLYSKGYYLEWMREHWIKDKDLLRLKKMVDEPQKYLQEEAESYKQYESTMEQVFWNSKIDTKTFSYHEN